MRTTQRVGSPFRAARLLAIALLPAIFFSEAACAKRTPGIAGLNGGGSSEAVSFEGAAASPARSEMAMASATAPAPQSPPPPPSGPNASPNAAASRQLIRTASTSLEAVDPQEVAQKLQDKAVALGGFLQSLGSQRLDDGSVRFNLSLRVPAEQLDALRAEARTLAARVVSEQLQTEDVTDQLVDLGARLKTLRATEGELQALLAASRAEKRKVEEIMAVYRELSEIRTQIEQIDAQQVGLERRVALSTLDLTIWPLAAARPLAGEGWRPLDTLRSSLGTLVGLLRSLGDFLIFAVVVLLPLGLVIWLVVRVLKRLWRARKPKSAPKADPPTE